MWCLGQREGKESKLLVAQRKGNETNGGENRGERVIKASTGGAWNGIATELIRERFFKTRSKGLK